MITFKQFLLHEAALTSAEQTLLDKFIAKDADERKSILDAAIRDPKISGPLISAYKAHLTEAAKITEPGWYVVDHMDKPIKGPMQEGAAKDKAEEMSEKHAATRGKGDIPAFSAEYFSDYEIRRMNEAP